MNRWNKSKLAFSLMRDSRIPFWVRASVPAAVFLYVISPVDLVPDFILGVGQLDDLAIVILGVGMLTSFLQKFAPSDVVQDHLGRLFESFYGPDVSPQQHRSEVVDADFRVRD